MGIIKVLDCTLRDGGYVNNWEFGYKNILMIKEKLEKAGADILEFGFMRNEPYQKDRAIYNSIDQVASIIKKKRPDKLYSVLIEMANFYPLELLANRREDGPDLIRYSFWMRCLDEAYAYAYKIVEKGYMLGVQPTRVEQYSNKQFADMCRKFSGLKPYAIYIVDTFGLLTKEQLVRYARIADQCVAEGIYIGYHAHNNMQQAYSNVTTFIELGLEHDIVVDGSVYGMGRGAGNLNLELLGHYLNATEPQRFDINAITDIWDGALKEIYEKFPWGYTLQYFLAAANQCNPNYATYYLKRYPNMNISDFSRMIGMITGNDKFLFSEEKAEFFYRMALKGS